MIYIIGSCYLSNYKEEWIVLKNKRLLIEEMTNIVGALSNLYFLSTEAEFCPPVRLQNVLCEKLQCKERKHKYTGELEAIRLRVQPPMLHTTFVLCDELVIWIDIKEAMYYTKGRMWEILNTHFKEEDIREIEEKWKMPACRFSCNIKKY